MKSAAEKMQIKKMPMLRARLMIALIIFLLAFGVRLLSWHDTRLEVGKVQTVVTGDYKLVARMLKQEGVGSFFRSPPPAYAVNALLAHPPGYSILIYLVYAVCPESDTALQLTQVTLDSFSVVLAFLIAAELLTNGAALVTGLLAALSPQLAWNSVLLLPDSVAVLPILLAIYLLARSFKRPRLINFLIAGALIGLSCWLRANGMLLTFLFAAAVPLLINSKSTTKLPASHREDAGTSWRFALAVICGTLLIVLPLTIRNAIVFHRFIPLSLGAGQTLLEGIADYDNDGRFNIPRTDMGILKQEAESYDRPDYYSTFFNPDGVERERARLGRGFAVIRAHPFWFASVMARRATSMVRLERSRLISIDPPVSHSLEVTDKLQPVWADNPVDLLAHGMTASPRANTSLTPDTEWLAVSGDESTYGDQFSISSANVNRDTDYVFTVPIRIEKGRMRVEVKSSSGKVYSSVIIEMLETISPEDQPLQDLKLPFVAREHGPLQIVLSNEASNPPGPLVDIGAIKLYELGPARFLWTRYPRFIVRGIQRIFLTAVVLPLAIIGLLILIFQMQSRALVVLSIVPVYFFTVQSVVHTEYRYVLAVDYFLFALAGVTVCWFFTFIFKRVKSYFR